MCVVEDWGDQLDAFVFFSAVSGMSRKQAKGAHRTLLVAQRPPTREGGTLDTRPRQGKDTQGVFLLLRQGNKPTAGRGLFISQ